MGPIGKKTFLSGADLGLVLTCLQRAVLLPSMPQFRPL